MTPVNICFNHVKRSIKSKQGMSKDYEYKVLNILYLLTLKFDHKLRIDHNNLNTYEDKQNFINSFLEIEDPIAYLISLDLLDTSEMFFYETLYSYNFLELYNEKKEDLSRDKMIKSFNLVQKNNTYMKL